MKATSHQVKVESGRRWQGERLGWTASYRSDGGVEVTTEFRSRASAEEYARFLGDLWLFLDSPGMNEAGAVALLVDGIKGEVREDIAAGAVPADVASFSALHNHVDANGYGGAFNWPGAFSNEYCTRFWNAVQGKVDEWLKAGRP